MANREADLIELEGRVDLWMQRSLAKDSELSAARARIARLEAALEPFARFADLWEREIWQKPTPAEETVTAALSNPPGPKKLKIGLHVRAFRRAKAAYEGE